jgi:hypothetical protein
MRFGVGQFFLRSVAVVLLLCLSIAPLCATRCALTSCLPSAAPQPSGSGCHHATAKSHGKANLGVLASNACQTGDTLLASLPAQQFRLLKPISNQNAHELSASLISSVPLTSHDEVALRASRQDSSPGNFPATPSITPLRI